MAKVIMAVCIALQLLASFRFAKWGHWRRSIGCYDRIGCLDLSVRDHQRLFGHPGFKFWVQPKAAWNAWWAKWRWGSIAYAASLGSAHVFGRIGNLVPTTRRTWASCKSVIVLAGFRHHPHALRCSMASRPCWPCVRADEHQPCCLVFRCKADDILPDPGGGAVVVRSERMVGRWRPSGRRRSARLPNALDMLVICVDVGSFFCWRLIRHCSRSPRNCATPIRKFPTVCGAQSGYEAGKRRAEALHPLASEPTSTRSGNW